MPLSACCWVEHPLGLALNEGSPQEACVIVGTTVEVLPWLWERQERLEGCQNGSHLSLFLSLRFPWQLIYEDWQESCPNRSPPKGKKREIKAKKQFLLTAETQRRVATSLGKDIEAHTVSLTDTWAPFCFQTIGTASQTRILMICMKCLAWCLHAVKPPWISGSQPWLYMEISREL